MTDFTSKLREKLAIIYEMDGMAAVEDYAKANGIPVVVCRELLDAYATVAPSEPKLNCGAARVSEEPRTLYLAERSRIGPNNNLT